LGPASDHPFTNPDYLRVPNYERSRSIEELDNSAMDTERFRREYINRNRPVVIRGAARHWPAYTHWKDPEYLKRLCGDFEFPVFDAPRVEGDPVLFSDDKRRRRFEFHKKPLTQIRMASFLDAANAAEPPASALFFLYSLQTAKGHPLEVLRPDIGTYSFLQKPQRSSYNIYPSNNVFLYRTSVTDWHYHATAEALQTQILGTKEVLILPPSEAVWAYMSEVQANHLHAYEADLLSDPRAQSIVPYRVVLQAGDALYIPNYWWHFVSTKGNNSLGITVPTWWDSPFHVQLDFRFPAARAAVRSLLRGTLPWRTTARWLPAVVAGVTWSTARRYARPSDAPWFLANS